MRGEMVHAFAVGGVVRGYHARAQRYLITFTFAAAIAWEGTFSLKGPVGSGKSGFSFKGRMYVFQDRHSRHVVTQVIF